MKALLASRWIDAVFWTAIALCLGVIFFVGFLEEASRESAAPPSEIHAASTCVKRTVLQNARGERAGTPWTRRELVSADFHCRGRALVPDPAAVLQAQIQTAAAD